MVPAASTSYVDAATLDRARDGTLADSVRQHNKRLLLAQTGCTVLALCLVAVCIVVLAFVPSVALLVISIICILCFLLSLVSLVRMLRRRRAGQRRRGDGRLNDSGSSDIEVDGFMYNQEDGTFVPILAVPERNNNAEHAVPNPANTLPGMPILQTPHEGNNNNSIANAATQGSLKGNEDGDKVYGRATYYMPAPAEAQPHKKHAFDDNGHRTPATDVGEVEDRGNHEGGREGKTTLRKPERQGPVKHTLTFSDEDTEGPGQTPLAAQAAPPHQLAQQSHEQQHEAVADDIDLWLGTAPATTHALPSPSPQPHAAASTSKREEEREA